MIAFVALSVLLAFAVAIALAWPLRRRSRRAFLALAAATPLLALCLYQLVGTPAGLDPGMRESPDTLEDAVARLEADLERDPRQIEGWRLLGRAYREMGRPADAREALERAARLDPEDLSAQVEYAQARSLADPQQRFDEEAARILERVLALDPGHDRARLFLGIAQRQAGRDADAAATWEPLLARLGGEAAAGLREQIDAARAAAGLPPLETAAPEASPHAVTVRVSFDPDFAASVRVDPDAAVFVIARVPGGPPMPVAVQRRYVSELPLELVLDDGDSPMPTQTLSDVGEVELVARISSDGSATPQEDDVTSVPVRIALPADAPVELVLGGIR